MPFRFIEHTADVQVECAAANFEGLLDAASEALYAIALKETRAATTIERRIEVAAASRENLLVRWLQELIFLLDTQGFVGVHYDFIEASPEIVLVTARGYSCTADDRAEEVKSATYHGLEVRETPDGFVARVLFDL